MAELRPPEAWPDPRARGGRQILGVTFDLDDTLYDNRPVLEHAECALYAWLTEHHPRVAERYDREALRSLRHEVLASAPALRHDVSALRKRALALAADRVGCDPALAEEGFRVFWQCRNRVALYGDVLPVLSQLRRRYVLGAITNGNADVGQIGLGRVFHFSICAAELGASKPEAPPFREALRRVGGEPCACVHVGDDALADIDGARCAGLRTVWLNRAGRPWDGGAPPDAEIRSLWELPRVIAALEGAR
jgi:putative hydrolase of the HAD superfamily